MIKLVFLADGENEAEEDEIEEDASRTTSDGWEV